MERRKQLYMERMEKRSYSFLITDTGEEEIKNQEG